MEATLGEIARLVGGELEGPADKKVDGVAPMESVGPTQISLAAEKRYWKLAQSTEAACIITGRDAPSLPVATIRVGNPRLAWTQVLELFEPPANDVEGVHKTAVIGKDVSLGKGVSIGANVVVGDRSNIGDRVVLRAGTVVGADVEIGDDSLIHANVTLADRVRVGQRVIIHSGTVIGADGFGFIKTGKGHRKVPQIGTVVIEDDVELGALVAVDRAVCGATVIGRGTKVDNLVQIAHNVVVGEDCLIVAQTGISGSVKVGDRVTFAGQTGVAGHLSVGDDSVIAARGVVAGDLPPRSFVSGFPARPHRDQMRVIAATHKLPAALDDIAALKRRIEELESRLQGLEEELPATGDPR